MPLTTNISKLERYRALKEKAEAILGRKLPAHIFTEPHPNNGTFRSIAIGGNLQLAQHITDVPGERKISESLRGKSSDHPLDWARLTDYFTHRNLRQNRVIKAEYDWLKDMQYPIGSGYYLPISVGPVSGTGSGFYFLLAEDEKTRDLFSESIIQLRSVFAGI